MNLFAPLKALLARPRARIRKYIDNLLEDSITYHTSLYPGNRSLIIKKILNRLTAKVKVDDHNLDKIKKIDPDNFVVFASKNKRVFDFLYLHTCFKDMELPYPELGFDFSFFFTQPLKRLFRIFISHMDYFLHHFHFRDIYTSGQAEQELLKGKSGFVCLIEEDDFYKRFIKSTPDPLFLLIEFQKRMDKSVIIVPEDIIYVSKPMHKDPGLADILLGTHEKPGLLKRLYILFRHPDKIKVAIANPVDLKEFIRRPEIDRLDAEFQTHKLRTYLTDILNRQRKSITGPVLKSRQEITEEILTRKSLREYLAEYAAAQNISLQKTNKKAASYINEIAANYNLRVINFGRWILTWVFKNIFEGLMVNQSEINRMREKSTEAPLILVPCHKSHLDYLLLPYVMYKNNMPCPHIAAGKNLSFWPLGPLFRGGGAFFLRRTFKGAELYSKIFAAYLGKLLLEGFNIKIFIEGGRSRTGKLLTPRPGGLAMIIRAYLDGACDNLYFVPIFIGYDRVLEEDAYLKEIEGGNKSPETLKGLISTRKFLKKKYGKVYIRFDEPISINDYIREKNIDLIKTTDKEYIRFIKQLGYKLINRINANAVATPHGIMASAILTGSSNTFSKRQLLERVNTYMNLLTFFEAELSDTLLIDPDNTLDTVIRTFISRNFMELADEDEDEITEDTQFIIKHNKRAILDYYKNSVISFFVPSAYTAVAVLECDRFTFSPADLVLRYKFLQKMFTDEFSYDEDLTCEEQISLSIKGFISQGILVPDSKTEMFNLTSSGRRKLKWFAAFMQPFLESYHTALVYFEKEKPGEYDARERGKKILSQAGKLYKRNQIRLKESISLINYRNAANYFMKNGINGAEDQVQIEHYKQIIDRLIQLTLS
ncbi:1-acyl-sn-glycerol-3-phosphate acyltransferase [Desulfospira joergensenii]|uniref:1-acyl-sn-glycerol-3-phosphate acyltransferase n=1 Tax=Desulfospira joergensenii TaxID=53329 RepID=UPI0003B70E4F|nr:1-acyl-sn-glycerol-3-phosphate acyltransferase [Desulfospira joergensenii]